MPTAIDNALTSEIPHDRPRDENDARARRHDGRGRNGFRLALIFGAAAVAAITGCATPRRDQDLNASGGPQTSRTFFVATTRTLSAMEDGRSLPDRSANLTFAEYTFPVPERLPALRGGEESGLSKSLAQIDPGDARILDARTFAIRLAASHSGKKPRIGVFVHGYNTTYPESVARVARMAADSGAEVTPVLFAWPSTGRSTGYVADRDAAAFSRDALAGLLVSLTTDQRLGEVTVFAHSMGAWLVVEALRQLRMGRAAADFGRLRVILAAPDIDIDLFRIQIGKIGALPNPMVILVSPDDRVLRLSGRIAGDRRRVGSLGVDDPRVISGARDEGLIVVDISDAKSRNALNHDKFVDLAKRYSRLSKAGSGFLRTAGAYIFDPDSPALIPTD